jgi:2,4-dienoyl-CoA reductase-like NADH-dependent reductase (Old Yellow Enzyme family)
LHRNALCRIEYYQALMAELFDPLKIRRVTLPNRIVVSPMCQYSSTDGYANDWHFVHLGSRAVGGAALVFTEAAAVLPEGRITPQDLGIWTGDHIPALARITRFIREQGAVPGMQLAHAGRKASTTPPWEGGVAIPLDQGGWTPIAPSAVPFSESYPQPREASIEDIRAVSRAFADAAGRAFDAGFRIIEIHSAHGYLFHEFLSPLSNFRQDCYGGPLENRIRFLCETVEAVRSKWPAELPLFVRISSTDWVEGGWDIQQSVELARALKRLDVDLVDCSSGGNVPSAGIPLGPGYQTVFAERIRREAGIMTGAVGLITSPLQSEHIVRTGQADVVLLAREMLRDPYWPLRAARELGAAVPYPVQYLRSGPIGSPIRTKGDE